MSGQKFKRGNLVKVLVGHQIFSTKEGAVDIRPEYVARKAIIRYSYAEEYGGDNIDDYSITWLDSGDSLAWKHERELELLDEGGEHLFEEAKANKEKIYKL